jgi:hypothetical protein
VLSPYSKRYLKGPSGEWLDAFGFANFETLGMQWNVKAGQHTVYWGDSLCSAAPSTACRTRRTRSTS